MNNEERDRMLIAIHGSVHELHTKQDVHSQQIETIRLEVKEMSGNKTQIKLLWGMVCAAVLGAIGSVFHR